MKPKRIVITGSSAGIGYAGARAMVQAGWEVLVHGRTKERALATAQSLQQLGPSKATAVWGDLSDLRQVRDLMAQVADHGDLQVLWNNAGLMTQRLQLSAQGFELQWAVNHLAAYVLAHGLAPLLVPSKGRVIFTSSFAHVWGSLPTLSDIMPHKKYQGFKTYGSTKLANILTALDIRRTWAKEGIGAWSFHPGYVKTTIGSEGRPGGGNSNWFLSLFMTSVDQGAKTGIHLASQDQESLDQAPYWSNMRPQRSSRLVTLENVTRLHNLSESLVSP